MTTTPAPTAKRLPGDIRRVLVMKWSAMGDVALATCVMQDLVEALPGARFHLDTPPRFAALFANDPRFERVLGIDVRQAGPGGMLRWLREVARARYDAVVDLQSTDRSRLLLGLLTVLGRAPRVRIGNHRRWPYTVAPPAQPREVHALEHLRATLRACGIVPAATTPVLHPGSEHEQRVAGLLREFALDSQPFALFMPGCQAAGWLKRWGWRRFAALAVALTRRGIARVVLVGAEDERDECDAIAAAIPDIAVNLCGRTQVLDVVALARAARLVVANDTGTAHVAAVADRPMVVVCGPTDPRRVRPAGDSVRTCQAELHCINCYLKTCTHHSCMQVLGAEQVLAALEDAGAFDAARG